MAKASIKALQAHIDVSYPEMGVKIYKGAGYFYFDSLLDISSIYVYALNHASLDRWKEMVSDEIDCAIEEEKKLNCSADVGLGRCGCPECP